MVSVDNDKRGNHNMVVNIMVIALSSFMVCFYVLHVMSDWGVGPLIDKDNQSKKVPKSKNNR